MSARTFADYLGIAERTVTYWEKYRASTRPRPHMQAALDTALARADEATHARFDELLRGGVVEPDGTELAQSPEAQRASVGPALLHAIRLGARGR